MQKLTEKCKIASPIQVHLKSGFILNGVCVLWRGWIDLQRLEGFGCLEFDEYRAYIEEAMAKQQIDKQSSLGACNNSLPPAPPAQSLANGVAIQTAASQASHMQAAAAAAAVAASNSMLGAGLLPPPPPPPPQSLGGVPMIHPQQQQQQPPPPPPPPHPPVSLAASAEAQYGNAAIAAAAAAAFHQALSVGAPLGHALGPLGLPPPPPPHHMQAYTPGGASLAHLAPQAQQPPSQLTNGASFSPTRLSPSGQCNQNSNPSCANSNNNNNKSTNNNENSASPAQHSSASKKQQQQQQATKRPPEELGQTQLDEVDVVSDMSPDEFAPPRRIFKSDPMLNHPASQQMQRARRAV